MRVGRMRRASQRLLGAWGLALVALTAPVAAQQVPQPTPPPGAAQPAPPAGAPSPPAPVPPPPPPPAGYYYGPPPPAPAGYYYGPPAPPPPDVGVHTHEGFYLRLGLGFGYGQVTSKVDDFEASYKGAGWLMDLLVGGTVGNTVTFGGGVLFHQITRPAVEDEFAATSEEADGPVGIVTVGPFVDFHFGPHSGGHVGTMFGLAVIGLEDQNGAASSGWGWSLFGGYDFWVSDNWGVGVNARYMYSHGERYVDTETSTNLTDTAHSFGVMFSALYD